MSRKGVFSMRLDVLDRETFAVLAAAANQPLSEYVRDAVYERANRQPACGVGKAGTWNSTYLPVCQLPVYHREVPGTPHMWRDDRSGTIEVWSDGDDRGRMLSSPSSA